MPFALTGMQSQLGDLAWKQHNHACSASAGPNSPVMPKPSQLAFRWWGGPSLQSKADGEGSPPACHPRVFTLLTPKHCHAPIVHGGDSNCQMWPHQGSFRRAPGLRTTLGGQPRQQALTAELSSPPPNPSHSRGERGNKKTKWTLKSWLQKLYDL